MTGHCADLLPEYAAGSLTGAERDVVRVHLKGCRECRAELASWEAVAGVVAKAAPTLVPPAAVPGVLHRAALIPQPVPAGRRGVHFGAQLLRAELRLVRPAVWLASLLVLAWTVGVAALAGGVWARTGLSLAVPLVAAAGVAGVYGPHRDPSFEALAATVTSPRLVLIARVTLVFAYDLALALAASAVVHLAAPPVRLVDLVTSWLGPMALLSALSLLLALWIGPNVSVALAMAAWALRVVVLVPEFRASRLAAWVRDAWATTPGTAVAAIVLLAAALAAARRRPAGHSGSTGEPLRG